MGRVIPLLSVVQPAQDAPDVQPWSRGELVGRLVELSGQGASAVLTVAFGLVVQAQTQGEPVAWICAHDAMFFPPDAASGGVDLEAMLVVRTIDSSQAGRAADKLLRCGAFGLVILDLGGAANVAMGLQARLVKLAQKHDAAVLCLTEKARHVPSLSSMVSLRCQAERTKADKRGKRFVCEVTVIKDKRRGPRWHHEEECRGPPGLH